MALPIFGEIERLITEHGSAAILKERISQLREQMDFLEKKSSALDGENIKLKTERDALQVQVVNLRQEIQGRDDVVQKEKSHSNRLEEIKEKILKILSEQNEANCHQISHTLSANEQVVTFHLTELENINLVNPSYIMNSPVIWSIAHEGRKYLISHGLLA